MKLLKCVILLLLLHVVSAPKAHAHGPDILLPPLYKGESNFTLIPAYTGMAVSAVPGAVLGTGGYIIGYAAGLPFGREKEFADNAFSYPMIGITMLGSAVAGAPFYLLEKVFYDFPCSLLESDKQTAR